MLNFFSTADTTLGRADIATFTDQMLMELIITEGKPVNTTIFRDQDGDFTDVCEWSGVTCDADANVTEIAWVNEKWLCFSFSFDYLPQKLQKLDLRRSKLALQFARTHCAFGTLNTEALPRGLREFRTDYQGFRGTINLRALPATMEVFGVLENRFRGGARA